MPQCTNHRQRGRRQAGPINDANNKLSNIRSNVYISVCMDATRLGIAILNINKTTGTIHNNNNNRMLIEASEVDDAFGSTLRGIIEGYLSIDNTINNDTLKCLIIHPKKSPILLRNILNDIQQQHQQQQQLLPDLPIVDDDDTPTTTTVVVRHEALPHFDIIERPTTQYDYPSCVQRVIDMISGFNNNNSDKATLSSLPITGGHAQLWRAVSGLLSFLDETGLLNRYRPSGVVTRSLQGMLLVDSVTLRTLGITSVGRSTTIVAGHNHRLMTPSIARLLERYISSPPGRLLLQRWLALPHCDINIIESRLKDQEIIIDNLSPELTKDIGKYLKKHRDLSRILNRVVQGFNLDSTARVATWLQLLRSCRAASDVIRSIEMLPSDSAIKRDVGCISRLLKCRTSLLQIQNLIEGSFDMDACMSATTSGPQQQQQSVSHLSVKTGVIPQLDELRSQYDKLEDILTRMGAAESKALEDMLLDTDNDYCNNSILANSIEPISSLNDTHLSNTSNLWYDNNSTSGIGKRTHRNTNSCCSSSRSLLSSRPIRIQLQYFPQMGFVASIPSTDVEEVLVPLLSNRDTIPHSEQQSDTIWQRCIDIITRNLEGWQFKFRTSDTAYFKSPITCRLDNYLGNIETKMKDIELADRLEAIGTHPLAIASSALAELDCLIGLARASRENGWCKPVLIPTDDDNDDIVMDLIGSWHPLMVDDTINNDNRHLVVSNNIIITSDCKTHILTGPNYSGKSVLLKQIGITAFLSHCGLYVPAKSCRIRVISQLFARTASSDQKIPKFVAASERRQLEDIVRSNSLLSTFTRDAHEVSVALSNCTCSSLILLDEFGKGTSPVDEVSLLAGIIKYTTIDLCKAPPTLILTSHYGAELFSWGLVENATTDSMHGVEGQAIKRSRNITIGRAVPSRLAVVPSKASDSANDGSVSFLYKLERGKISQSSYPIQCAIASGVCPSVTNRALEIFNTLRAGRPISKPRDPDDNINNKNSNGPIVNDTTIYQTLVRFSKLDLSSPHITHSNRAALHNIVRLLRGDSISTPNQIPSITVQQTMKDVFHNHVNLSNTTYEAPKMPMRPLSRTVHDLPSSSKGWGDIIDEDLLRAKPAFKSLQTGR